MKIKQEGNVIALLDIKDEYYRELALGICERMELEKYIKNNYVQIYDKECNFLGWEHV